MMCIWQVVPAWLNCLPIKGDLIEAKVVHDQLCSMVERSVHQISNTSTFLLSFSFLVCFSFGIQYLTFLHPFLLSIYRSDRELLGPNNQYLPKIVAVFAEVSVWFVFIKQLKFWNLRFFYEFCTTLLVKKYTWVHMFAQHDKLHSEFIVITNVAICISNHWRGYSLQLMVSKCHVSELLLKILINLEDVKMGNT